jgi:hypothetical protein
VIIFGSVRFLSKKAIKPKFFLKKKTEIGSNRPVSVRFGFLGQKPVQTGLARFFLVGSVWLSFFRFGSVFFGFGLVFFGFRLIKRNRTEPVGFFKILIGLIGLFFFQFSRSNQFFGFFTRP